MEQHPDIHTVWYLLMGPWHRTHALQLLDTRAYVVRILKFEVNSSLSLLNGIIFLSSFLEKIFQQFIFKFGIGFILIPLTFSVLKRFFPFLLKFKKNLFFFRWSYCYKRTFNSKKWRFFKIHPSWIRTNRIYSINKHSYWTTDWTNFSTVSLFPSFSL